MSIPGNQPSATTSTGKPSSLESVLDAIPEPVVVLDRSLRPVRRNRAAIHLLGSSTTIVDALSTEPPVDWAALLGQVMETRVPQRLESVVYRIADGQTCTLNLTAAPLADETDQVSGVLITAQDITQRSTLEKRLAMAQSMATVGRLAARVAHELNNPLDGCLRYIKLCARLLDDQADDKVRGYLDEARQGLVRMAGIVGELLEFSRTRPDGTEDGNVNWIVEEAIRALSDQADRHNVVVAASFQNERIPHVQGAKLFQVCCNLIKNAIDAMPGGGCLTVATALLDRHVVIRFEDTGVGLPENVERLFEPFYTTKPPGEGTGLGLAICKDYIEQLHGEITARPGNERGAVFTIRIPVESRGPDEP